jgi:hypothetical protein
MNRISLLPLVCYAVLLCFAGQAALTLGHWPHYNHPDPKRLYGPLLMGVAGVTMLLGLLSVVALPCGYGIYRAVMAGSKRPVISAAKPAWVYGAGATLWILDITAEFTRLPWPSLAGWIMD